MGACARNMQSDPAEIKPAQCCIKLVFHWNFQYRVKLFSALCKGVGVKIVINDNIIEQVTNFKCLGYRISEYGSDLEDKLQTYNKINGVIRRHFGKQMNKETKLRIHNITATAVLKFGSEAWVLKKREEQRLEGTQIKKESVYQTKKREHRTR